MSPDLRKTVSTTRIAWKAGKRLVTEGGGLPSILVAVVGLGELAAALPSPHGDCSGWPCSGRRCAGSISGPGRCSTARPGVFAGCEQEAREHAVLIRSSCSLVFPARDDALF